MKPFLIMTAVWIVAVLLCPILFRGQDPYGFGILWGMVYTTVAYVFALFTWGMFKRAKALTHSANDPMPSHMEGLVRRSQMPEWAAKRHSSNPDRP